MQTNPAGPIVRRTLFDGFTVSYLLLVALFPIMQPTEAQLYDMKFNTLLFVGVWTVGGALSFALNRAGIKTLGEVLFAPSHKRVPSGQPKAWYQAFWGWHTLVTLVVTLVVGVFVTRMSAQALLDIENIGPAGKLFQQLFSPDWSLLPQAIMTMIETLYIAFMATAIAVPLAFVLSFLSAKNVMGTSTIGILVYGILRFAFNLSRSIEPLIWAIIFSVWVGIGPFAGMLALMIHSVSSLAKQYSEFVEGVDEGPIEGIRSTGANTLQTVWFAIVPQVTLPYISYTIYRWDTNVRMATIIGLVGGGGIGNLLIQYQGQSLWPQVGCIIFVIAFVVWVMDAFSAYVREALK